MKRLFLPVLLYMLTLSPVGAQEKKLLPPEGPPPEVLVELQKAKAETEEARKRAEAVVAGLKTSIQELETRLQKVEEESVRAMEPKDLPPDTMASAVEQAQTAQLESASKEGVKTLSEELLILKDTLRTEEELLKVMEERVALLERRVGLAQEIEATSIEKAATAPKEVEIAESYLQAANSKLKEKETSLEKSKNRLKEVQEKAELRKRELEKESKTLEELPFQKEEMPQRFVRNLKLLYQRRLSNLEDRVAAAEKNVHLAQVELERAKIDTSNAQRKVALLRERALLLEKKLKAEQLKKMEEEAELARKAEEEKKKKAEEEKAAIRKEREEALRKEEELTKKQQEAVSPEQKRVLDLEAALFALREQIAKKKEALITEGTRASEHATEYKKLDRDVLIILGGENTPSEVAAELTQLQKETARWKEKLASINSLADATQKEKALLTEQLQEARVQLTAPPGEVSKVEKEAQMFQDKAAAAKFIAHAKERVKLLEENQKIIDELASEIEKEKNIVINNGLKLLTEAMAKLNKIRVSNIWVRRQWANSWLSMKEGLAKVLLPKKISDLMTITEKPAEKGPRLLLAAVGISVLIAATGFGSYYCRKWCRINLKRLEEAGLHAEDSGNQNDS